MNLNRKNTTLSIAFTLVELLVVISIIGLLAGLAVPAINGGLKSAKAGACLSNLHQIGIATMAYAADNSFKLPPGGSDGENNWARDVYNYCGATDATKSSKKTLFLCPGCSKSVKTEVVAGQIPLTYSGHKGLMRTDTNIVLLSSVARPTEVILAGDGCQITAGGYAGYVIDSPSIFSLQTGKGGSVAMETAISTAPDSDSGAAGALRYRHAGKVNVVMCDGHAEAIAKGKVLNKHVIYGQ